MNNCKHLEEAYKYADGELSGAAAASFIAHAAQCADCSAALDVSRRTKNYYGLFSSLEVPSRLGARVGARLREMAEDDWSLWLRAMVPAGALAFAALGCWLMIDREDLFQISDLLLGHDNEVAEVLGPHEDPVAVLKLEL